jgi:methylmalonyl-CoA decarboxylase
MTFTRFRIDDAIATITFDRDAKRNAFSHAMSEEVLARLDEAQAGGARVVILRANPGVRAWCAGHDLGDLRADSDPTRSGDPMLRLFDRVREIPLPVIALVEGSVYAGGLVLVVVCDLAVAAEGATVAMTANRLGIPFTPEMYAYFLRVLGLHKTKELFFTAEPISAEDARTAGIFNHVVPADTITEFTDDLARKMLRCSPAALADTKSQLDRLADQTALPPDDLAAIEAGRRALLERAELRERLDELRRTLGRGDGR